MSNSPSHSGPDPFDDHVHRVQSPPPANNASSNPPSNNSSTNSSITPSRGGSRPGSAGGERRSIIQRVRFGAGEAMDHKNVRTSFHLRGGEEQPSYQTQVQPSSSGPHYPQELRTPPIMLTGPDSAEPDSYFSSFSAGFDPIPTQIPDNGTRPTNYPPLAPPQMPPRAHSCNSVREEDSDMEELNEKIEETERARKVRSISAPGSTQGSPTLNAFSVGAGQAQGGVPVNIPLLNIDGGGEGGGATPSATPSPPSKEGGPPSEPPAERPKVIAVKEAHDLVRQHTRREGPLGARLLNRGQTLRVDQPAEPAGAQTPNVNKQHADYVQPPEHFRGGVLSSLLKLYNPSNTGQAQSSGTASQVVSPTSSGRTTPKWYNNKSSNQSASSLGGLLAASGSALIAPAAGVTARRERPKLKSRSHSGGGSGAFGALKSMARPNLEEEIRITVHIAETLARQTYILKLCRALMLYGAPTHRLEEALKMTSRVLEIDGQFLYIPGCMVIAFGDQSTHTSDMQLVKSPQGVDLGKLHDTHIIYKEVVHDVIGVEEATQRLDEVLKRRPKHSAWKLVPVYGVASAVVGPFGFKARPIDMPILFLLGSILGFLQLIVAPRSEYYSNVFEMSAAIITSFLARAFGSIRGGKLFCFSALAQASIALILPGYIILCGALELQSKNMVAGSVRMFYAIVYSLFLGFGITIGSALYGLLDSNATSDTTCSNTLNWRWNFLFVPPFAYCLMVINQARYRQIPVMLGISAAGYVVNFFSSQRFSSQPQVANGLGAFVVGILGNMYARVGHGLAFAAMLPAIFVQVPSGLAAQGSLISGVQSADALKGNTTAQSSSLDNASALQFGYSMIQVAIGITVGLFAAALVVYPLGKKRSGLFSF